MNHKQTSKEAKRLGNDVSKQTVVFDMTGRSPMLVHNPCYNEKITQHLVKGIIQVRKKGGRNSNKSDHPSNFYYQCECCGEKFPYQ